MYPRTRQKLKRGLGIALLVAVGGAVAFVALQPYERYRAHAATMEPFEIDRRAETVLPALRAAAERIGGWSYVGTAGDGDRTQVVFTRDVRLPPGTDDVTVTLIDLGDRTRVSGRSIARREWADLGRNRRNLDRLHDELDRVLEGAETP